ncbi:GTP binding Elongation factor Tu family protein [Hibiscus syriacus]|uniref:GTP binding Elongation factor Tu family protein n=1 Tax=Hibiscus syriacus TaxID=106335 RepID=A0A6A3C5M1_HIBSY|nr:GTP binding Elongation factor Tu family protein [Hibiscus syriacus]
MSVWFCVKGKKVQKGNFGNLKSWDSLHKINKLKRREMIKLCLMASNGCPPGPELVLHREQGVSRKWPSSLPCKIMKPEMASTSPFDLKCNGIQGQPKTVPLLCEPKLIVHVDPKAQTPVVIDKPVAYLDTSLFSCGIAEKCTLHEKFLKFLMSGLKDVDRGELYLSLLSNLIPPLIFGVHQQPSASLIYPSSAFDGKEKPLPGFVGEMICDSRLTVNSDGQVVFADSGTEIKDILSVVAEFHLSSNSTKWRMQSGLVPYFYWKRSKKVHASMNLSPQFDLSSVAPPKSPEKLKLNPSRKMKTSKKLSRERNLYTANYFHACETLLSLMVNRRRTGKTVILSLKKSGPELPHLLAQFSTSIAGTGLAVLFSLLCGLAYTRAPFCTSKLFSTSLGLGLVWLSWAVNRLRDTIVQMSKNGSKSGLNEKEMIKRVEKSVNDIYFRAGTLMAIAMLRFA